MLNFVHPYFPLFFYKRLFDCQLFVFYSSRPKKIICVVPVTWAWPSRVGRSDFYFFYSFYFFISIFISRVNAIGKPDTIVHSQPMGLYVLEFHIYLKKFLHNDEIISRDHLVAYKIVHFTHLTLRRGIRSFGSDFATPTSKGRSDNRNHTYLFWPKRNPFKEFQNFHRDR